MDISIIIVNYNTAHLISQAIDSVLTQENVSFEILVVDNASQDGSVATLKNYSNKIKLIANQENLGFGKANNLAFKEAQGRYLFLLNPDACFQTNDALAKMIAFMQINPTLGIAGTKIINANNTQTSLPSYYYPGQKHLTTDFSHLPGEIAWLLGASLIIRTEVYKALNGFDEEYFLYGEDTDICFRARKLGYAIGYNDQIIVKHIGGASEKKTIPYELWQKKQNGLHLFFKKNYLKNDAIKIVKKNLWRAYFRLQLLSLRRKLFKLDSANTQKYFRYKAIYDNSKIFLTDYADRKHCE